jgi:hypothetical protein
MKIKWELMEWDGNHELKLQCYRKKFGRGNVSIGVGEFKTIVYSYGANSEDSLSGTRWRAEGDITVEQAMDIVDRNNGKYNYKDDDPIR